MMTQKIIAAVMMTGFFYFSNAQTTETSVIVKGGGNFSNISTSNDGSVDKANVLPAYQVGAVLDIPLGSVFYLQPGLLYTSKGSKIQDGNPGDLNYYKATFNPQYIELPVNLVGKLNLGKGANIFVGAGPYAAIGVAGKNKVEGSFEGIAFSHTKNIVFSNDDPTTTNYEEDAGRGKIKRFDAGLNFTTGLELGRTVLSFNYGMGLTKINSGTDNTQNDNNKYRVVSLTFGLRF